MDKYELLRKSKELSNEDQYWLFSQLRSMKLKAPKYTYALFKWKYEGNGSWNAINTGSKTSECCKRIMLNDITSKLDGKSFHYDFGGDWWGRMEVCFLSKKIKNTGATYDFMVNDLIKYGYIRTKSERNS